jgi:intracellular sulfur oxidation DsrE/DsrF family protein
VRDQPNRREFIGRLGATSAAAFVGQGALNDTMSSETWDMSWVEKLKAPTYKAVIDANTLEEGYAVDLASGLYSTYKDVHNAGDDQVRIVIVARRGGTPLVFGDAIWDKYPISTETKMMDNDNTPYRRNPFYRPRPGASPESATNKIESLSKRGAIFLVCNVAANNWVRSLAEKTQRDREEVKREVFANLVPGTIVMPSGVFALMRAQNAGCAYMRGQ